MAKIKKITVKGTEYNIDASYLGGTSSDEYLKQGDDEKYLENLVIRDDNDNYPGVDNFSSVDVDTTYYSKGIYLGCETDHNISFPNKSGTFALTDDLYISTTWSELKTLRDNSQLIKGATYRITDYQCTTTQFDTQSAGHVFDILVVADDVSILNENAHAIIHSGDTYFANSKLSAWELKYCLDNDTTRFAWADSTNGKGVIYYMKDEFNNECPYDFKNIQFKRYKVTDATSSGILADLDGKYLGYIGETQGLTVDESDFIWCYTFTNYDGQSVIKDLSLSSLNIPEYATKNICEQNIIKSMTFNQGIDEGQLLGVLGLNNIIFIYDLQENGFWAPCLNFIDGRSFNMTFYNSCTSNTIEQDNRYIIAGSFFQQNTIKKAGSCMTFGNDCYSNTFGNSCYYNTFGNSCYSNTFGNDCSSNTFGNDCSSNTFGNWCNSNTFGSNCYSNTLLDNVTDNESQEYARWNIFDNGVQYVLLTSSSSGSYSSYLQNIHVHSGIQGTYSTKKTITADRNLSYSVDYFAKDSKEIILD